MSRVAQELRREARAVASAQTPGRRIEIALSIGDSDLELFRAAARVPEDVARRALERQRGRGRRASPCATGR